jgi:hypothetical protein
MTNRAALFMCYNSALHFFSAAFLLTALWFAWVAVFFATRSKQRKAGYGNEQQRTFCVLHNGSSPYRWDVLQHFLTSFWYYYHPHFILILLVKSTFFTFLISIGRKHKIFLFYGAYMWKKARMVRAFRVILRAVVRVLT